MKATKKEPVLDDNSFIDELYEAIGENDCNQTVSDYLSTGILPLNKIISGKYDGGIPVGRITELYGKSSSGKTLIATMAMIETQKKGGIAVFLDFEHAFSSDRAETLGLSLDKTKWIYKQPDTAEGAFDGVEKIIGIVRKSAIQKPITIVFDSVASMVTKEEFEATYENVNMKTRLSLASFMSSALRKIVGQAAKFNITLIFLNQTRDNPMHQQTHTAKEYTSGGNAMKFYASVRLELRKGIKVELEDKSVIGEQVTAKTVKNKIYSPFKTTSYVSNFDMGIDLVATHIGALEEQGVFGNSRGWLVWNGENIRKKEIIEKCRADKEFYDNILKNFV